MSCIENCRVKTFLVDRTAMAAKLAALKTAIRLTPLDNEQQQNFGGTEVFSTLFHAQPVTFRLAMSWQ